MLIARFQQICSHSLNSSTLRELPDNYRDLITGKEIKKSKPSLLVSNGGKNLTKISMMTDEFSLAKTHYCPSVI